MCINFKVVFNHTVGFLYATGILKSFNSEFKTELVDLSYSFASQYKESDRYTLL